MDKYIFVLLGGQASFDKEIKVGIYREIRGNRGDKGDIYRGIGAIFIGG